jgi:predicted nucleic acid-binding protein
MMAKIFRFYVDTSVFGGAFDAEFKISSTRFFDQIRDGELSMVISDVVVRELRDAPIRVRSFFDEMLSHAETAQVNQEALSLRQAYIDAGVLTPKWIDDALHVALASVNLCDGIVSWNFKHIVHYQKVPRYNAVNALQGYRPILIYSPQEVINYGSQDEEI